MATTTAHKKLTSIAGHHMQSDFDAGINTSNAWTVSREHDEHDPTLAPPNSVQDAQATIKKSKNTSLIHEADHDPLIDSISSLSLSSSFTTAGLTQSPTTASPSSSSFRLPIPAQNASEWISSTFTSLPSRLPSIRRSILGGKSLNRFSSFVTSGAEEWVLQGCENEDTAARIVRESSEAIDDDQEVPESDMHYIESGPAWRAKVPPFKVMVHSPQIRGEHNNISQTTSQSPNNDGAEATFTEYTITSVFGDLPSGEHGHQKEPATIRVYRRFTHFLWLHTALSRRLPGIALPPLPPKRYSGRFSSSFIEARMKDLNSFLNKLVRHPIIRYAEVLIAFLSCENEKKWSNLLSHHLSLPAIGPSFYAHVYHPHFNIDVEDATEAVERFTEHAECVGRGVNELRSVYARVREARAEMANAERQLSVALLSLITPANPASTTGVVDDTEQDDGDYPNDFGTYHQRNSTKRKKGLGLVNSFGAWCWREDCQECLTLTKNMQKAAESIQGVSNLLDSHAQKTMLTSQELLKDAAHPSVTFAPVMDTHRSTLSRYEEAADNEIYSNDHVAARCETVLNTTMAELDVYHTQKSEDFEKFTKDHLDAEIDLYEKILTRLRAARQGFDGSVQPQSPPSPRRQSIYHHMLSEPRSTFPPLTQPYPHVYD